MPAAPLWLFTGSEFGQKSDTVEEYRQKARRLFGQIDEYVFYANDSRIADIISLLQNASLFASARFIVVRNAEHIKLKADIELLGDWAKAAEKQQQPNQDAAWLILESDENSVDKKLENIVPKQNRIVFWELFESQKTKWLENWFAKAGFSIEKNALDTILDLVENNTQALRSECARFLLCFEKNHRITVEDVDAVLTRNRQESVFTLFAALCDTSKNQPQRFGDALTILQYIRHSKESSSVQLLAGFAYCFRKLQLWHNLQRQGKTTDFDLKINGFASKKMQQQYASASRIWNNADTAACLALIARTDMNIRQTGKNAETAELELMLYALAMRKGRPLESFTDS
ncbi:DNA polymerase III subunit delta [Treponema sp. OMZ 840]|uniref:DNA polymerase III subunit delta n=1 Tax=Treponema sp. OMZ 840 TaxID=244313 RepID=UPI003D94ED64